MNRHADSGIEPGTYRARDGALVHCRRDPGGRLLLSIGESQPMVRVPGPNRLVGAVKLSDDPYWPDEDDGTSEGVWLTD